ncbi:MAG: DNA polymerase III subunit beta [Bdellovibrionaceae bacterium]|nr:DNA polymerase III subunit beta [Pseudobdellovibrionaceae bacterium]
MKLEIEKKDLLNLIGKTQNIVDKRNTMPVLVNILLEATGDRLKVMATDLEVSLTDLVPAKISQEGKVGVSAKSLFEITRKLSDGPISLSKKENNWLEIKQGKYLSKIVGIGHEEYPVFPDYKPQTSMKIEASVFRDMIDKTIYSVSTDETRYHLNGVYFELSTTLKMIATDGHRMSLVTKNILDLPANQTQGAIIPRKGLHEINKIIEGADGEIRFSIEGSQFLIFYKSMTLMIRLIEGRYPDYTKFIPTNLPTKLKINTEAFLNCIERVSLLANQKSKAVLLTFLSGKLEISSNNPELGDAKEELEISYEGPILKIGFNAKYFTDILTNIKNEFIDFELKDQSSPSLIRPHNDLSYSCVLMPMRI